MVVAQKAIPPVAQEAIPKALLEADLERTQLNYERSRMVAEENRQKWNKDHEGCMARMRYHLRQARLDEDNALEQVVFLREEVAELEGSTDRVVDEKHVLEEAIDRLEDEIQQQAPLQQRCFIKHIPPPDTEVNDRKKFLRLLHQ